MEISLLISIDINVYIADEGIEEDEKNSLNYQVLVLQIIFRNCY